MKGRINNRTSDIVKILKSMEDGRKEVCYFYQNSNRCVLETKDKVVYLTIVHEGSSRQ